MSERPSFDETVDFTSADVSPSPTPAMNLPETPHLQLLDEIARGGMGAIWKGRDVDLRRDLAVKVLLEAHQGKTEMVQRFLEEAQIAGQLQHPGVAPVHQLGLLPDGRPYFTMKLVKGRTLAALLAARRDTLEERAHLLGVFAQVCQTLAYAHAHRVIHRDLKPSNVMVGAFGEVQVMDWGLAKVLREGGTETSRERPRADISIICTQRGEGASAMESGSFTQAGTVMGTPAYMAPEQARGDVEQVDERADVFGLGAILCEILTAKPPYTGTSEEIVYKARTAKLDGAFARLDACGADIDLISLAKCCLAAEPQDRPRHAGEAAEQVTAYQQSVAERLRQAELARAAEEARAAAARRVAVQERKARRMTLALAALVLLMLLLGGGGWFWLYSQRAMRRQAMNWAINEALTQAISLRNQARTTQGRMTLVLAAQAREQARRAEALIESGPADASLIGQVRTLLAELEADEKDMKLLAALDAARLAKAETNTGRNEFALEKAVPLFRAAFRAYGMPAGEGEATAAAARLCERPAAVRAAALAALEDWITLAEDPVWTVNEPNLSWLKAVRIAAEPEGWGKQVREAATQNNAVKRRAMLEQLATTADVEHLPARALTSLVNALRLVQAEESAVALLRRAQLHHAGDFWVNEALGMMLQKKQPQAAVPYLTAAAALRPDSAGAYCNLANALRDHGKLDEAVAAYKKAIALAPNYAYAHNNLAVVLEKQGKRDEAIAANKKAIELDPKFALPHYNLGVILALQGKQYEAIAAYTKALELDPKHAPTHNNLGLLLTDQGKWDEAIAAFKKAIELEPNTAPTHCNLGICLAQQGKRNEALIEFKKAIELDAKHVWAYFGLGNILREQGKWDEAITAYKKAIDSGPRYALPHNGLGTALTDRGKLDAAIDEYKKAIALDPKLALAHGNLARVLERQGKRDAALAAYRRAVELSPETHEYWPNYAALCLVQGDKDGYNRCRRDMLARFKDVTDPIIAEWVAKACLLLPVAGEELKRASALADRALAAGASHPLFAYFQLCKGLAEYRQGRLDSAVSWLQKASSQPRSPWWSLTVPAHFVLALAQHRRGEEEQARKSLAEAVRIYEEQHVAAANEKDAWICQILRREAESVIPSNAKKDHHESSEKPD